MASIKQQILSHKEEIKAIASRHKAEKVKLFGSVACEEDTDSSDVDFVIHPQSGFSLLDWVALIDDLTALLGRKTDVVVEDQLRPGIKEQILLSAILLD